MKDDNVGQFFYDKEDLVLSLFVLIRKHLLEAVSEVDSELERFVVSYKDYFSPAEYTALQTNIFHFYKELDKELRELSFTILQKIEHKVTTLEFALVKEVNEMTDILRPEIIINAKKNIKDNLQVVVSEICHQIENTIANYPEYYNLISSLELNRLVDTIHSRINEVILLSYNDIDNILNISELTLSESKK
jgi:hypothetical protein